MMNKLNRLLNIGMALHLLAHHHWRGMLARVLGMTISLLGVQYLTSKLNIVVGELSNLGIIDTKNLCLLGGAKGKSWDEVHDEENDAGSEEGVGSSRYGVSQLPAKLDPVVVQPSSWDGSCAVEMCYVVCGEEGSEDVSDETTDGVLSEDIKGIIDTDEELELGGVVGSCGSEDTEWDCGPGWDVS